MAAWIAQVAATVNGFSALTPIYFRFDGPPALAPAYPGLPNDPVRLFSLDSGHRVPVRVRYVADALGDPYLRSGTLVVSPEETSPLRGGERYAALVTGRAARPADFWTPPDAAAWIAAAARDGELLACHPSGSYDGHYCVFREEAGRAAFEALLSMF